MAVLDWLFEGKPPANVSSTTVTQTSLPDWHQEYTRGLLAKANAVAAEPYQPYTGQRVAQATPDQTSAYGMTRSNVGAYQPSFNTASDYFQDVGGGFNANEFNQYLNPYMTGVTDRIAQLGARNLTENLMPGVNDAFIGAGQPLGSRHFDFANRALRDTNEAILGKQAETLMTGYNNAMGAFQTGQGQQLAAGQALGTLGTAQQAAGLKDAAALQAIGQEQQALGQKSADVAYQDFLEQRNWPRTTADWMSNIVRGLQTSQTGTAQSNAPASTYQPSPLAALAGAAGSGAALYKSGIFG